jgi:hypothetical protein
MTLERPRFVPVGAPDHLHFRLDSELIGLTGLTAPQRCFLYERWEDFAMSVLFRDADNYMVVIFREWLENFPMPHYTSSDDPNEREYIVGVVKKVGFNTNTKAEGLPN